MIIIDSSYEILTPIDGMAMLKAIEIAGRTAYKSEDKITDDSALDFVHMLVHVKHHESVIEHQGFSVRFIVDRGVSHEMVRHRLMSPTQESSRYCDYSKDKFESQIRVIPMLEGLNAEQIARRVALYQEAEKVYMAELAEHIKPQQARDNLPTCLKTEIVVTANLREWRHIFKLRTAAAAHPQMRKVMIPLLKEIKTLIPVVFDDIDVPVV